ncbi:MAG: Lumazine-binding protein [Crocosphaera sp.]
MFTGFIRETGIIANIQSLDSGIELIMKVSQKFGLDIAIKSHVSLNGKVLTVLDKQEDKDSVLLRFYLSNSRKLSHYQLGEELNLERGIRLGEELPGIWFYGVPSGRGKILSMSRLEGEKLEIEIFWNHSLINYLDVKDQVCIDGVLLQIKKMTNLSMSFELYPETLKLTNLGKNQPENIVNIEIDPMIKKIGNIMEKIKINQVE